MNKVTVLVGVTVLALMAGCAKKEAPQAQDKGAVTTSTQPVAAAPKPEPKIDLSKAASEMAARIDPSPQCQKYRDELETKGKGVGPVDELSAILVQAYQAGCGKKTQK
jgi:hypothetical protein